MTEGDLFFSIQVSKNVGMALMIEPTTLGPGFQSGTFGLSGMATSFFIKHYWTE